MSKTKSKKEQINKNLYIESIAGIILTIIVVVLGITRLDSSMLFFRLIVGIGFGYSLSRAYMGFAGSVNRAYKTGSTKLMIILMFMFFISSVASIAFLYSFDPATYDLWINPINTGLILGGILFGFGMSLTVCCASGVLTDLVTGLPRALITLIFFGMGVFLGFPLQEKKSWIKDSWFTTETGEKLYDGVFFPDLFKFDGLEGFLGATILTALLSGIVIYIAKLYEDKRKKEGTYSEFPSEKSQDGIYNDFDSEPFKLFSKKTYEIIFVRPWTMKTGAVVITLLFTLLMGVTKAGWGASTPYGFWFGKLLMKFGVSAESLAEFSHKPVEVFTMPFFENQINVQNVGIFFGTIIFLLLSGKFKTAFTSELEITFKDAAIFALGGFLMGIGTRFANGCNVGALYTPIANFSLSGWIFLVTLVIGGILGNKFSKMIRK